MAFKDQSIMKTIYNYTNNNFQIRKCHVVDVKTTEKYGYDAVLLGAGWKKLKKTPRTMMGLFAKADVSPKRRLREFKVSPDALLPVGMITFYHDPIQNECLDSYFRNANLR